MKRRKIQTYQAPLTFNQWLIIFLSLAVIIFTFKTIDKLGLIKWETIYYKTKPINKQTKPTIKQTKPTTYKQTKPINKQTKPTIKQTKPIVYPITVYKTIPKIYPNTFIPNLIPQPKYNNQYKGIEGYSTGTKKVKQSKRKKGTTK